MITTVDIGGTKTLIAQFGDSLEPQNSRRFETPKDPQQFMARLLQELATLQEIDSLVIGAPGIVSNDGAIVRCGNLPWTNFRLRDQLANTYPCPIYVLNDAKLAGLAEINSITPVPALGLYISVGTGIGTAIITDGKLLAALANSEGGHSTIWDGSQWQSWEAVASGRALSAHFGKYLQDLQGEAEWRWVAEKMALGLYSLIPTLQPQVVVFGGGAGQYFERFREQLVPLVQEHISSYIQLPEMRTAVHAEQAVIYGGYYYARHQRAI